MLKINEAQAKKFIEMADEAIKRKNIEYRYEIVNGTLFFFFDKRIPTDDRPSKRSHILRIHIEEIIFQDYESIPDIMFNNYKNRIDEIIKQFNFDIGPKNILTSQDVTRWAIHSNGDATKIA